MRSSKPFQRQVLSLPLPARRTFNGYVKSGVRAGLKETVARRYAAFRVGLSVNLPEIDRVKLYNLILTQQRRSAGAKIVNEGRKEVSAAREKFKKTRASVARLREHYQH